VRGLNVPATYFETMQRSVFEAFNRSILTSLNTCLYLSIHRHAHVIVFHISLLFNSIKYLISSHARRRLARPHTMECITDIESATPSFWGQKSARLLKKSSEQAKMPIANYFGIHRVFKFSLYKEVIE